MSSNAWGTTAWGKVILLGEHAVVYGHKAIAGAIHLGLRCKVSEAKVSRLTVPAWNLDVEAGGEESVAQAFGALLAKSEHEPLHIEVEARLPAAAGLGSSAALCVALARVIVPGIAGQALHDLANLGESFFHKNPSGIDVALSADGGIGSYTKASGLIELPCAPLALVVGLSGTSRSTAGMVAGVAARREQDPLIDKRLQDIAKIAQAGEEALCAGQIETLGEHMDTNHRLLQEIGVSSKALDEMVACARGVGALGAKLTGAGGGGAMIALAPGKQEEVSEALRSAGYQAFVTTLGARA